MSSIKTIMKRDLLSLSGSATVSEAARAMSKRDLGSVLVVEDGQLVAILTERDVLTRVVAAGKNPEEITVGSVATSELVTVSPETEIITCYRTIQKHNIRHLPVVNDRNEPVGVISTRDFLGYYLRQMEPYTDMAGFTEKVGSLYLGQTEDLR